MRSNCSSGGARRRRTRSGRTPAFRKVRGDREAMISTVLLDHPGIEALENIINQRVHRCLLRIDVLRLEKLNETPEASGIGGSRAGRFSDERFMELIDRGGNEWIFRGLVDGLMQGHLVSVARVDSEVK